MRAIGKSRLRWIPQGETVPCDVTSNDIRKSGGIQVSNYLELAQRIAEVQYLNPEYAMVFRGQSKDYKDDFLGTTIRPSIFRGNERHIGRSPIEERFRKLKEAEQRLLTAWRNAPIAGNMEIKRYRVLRWSILQHYEICETPLLDVTYSLRVASSFASLGPEENGYVFVLGVPNISGTITSSMEFGLQVIRLSSVCPPQARRPHIQEGYLIGEYPDISAYEEKQNYRLLEIDFGLRLIAKFRLEKSHFWGDPNFPMFSRDALYPDAHDGFMETAKQLKQEIGN